MNNLSMNMQYGTKWFTFFTKVRPWLSCVMVFSAITEFVEYTDIYLSNWWLMLYLAVAIAFPVLNIMVFIKSRGDYVEFVYFVKRVLIFEIIGSSYQNGVKQYLQSDYEIVVAIIGALLMLLISYFVWYRLNVKYFRKRIIGNNATQYVSPKEETNKIRFCRKCGYELINDSDFCSHCGTRIVKNMEMKKDEVL